MSPTKKRSWRTAVAAAIGAAVLSAMAFVGAAPAFANDQGQGDFKPYEVGVWWKMDSPNLANPSTYEFPQTRLSGEPAPTCTAIKVQFDKYWIRDASDEQYLKGLMTLRSKADDARLEPHGYFAKIIVKSPEDCLPTPPATPAPTSTTTNGDWQGGTPTCENPSVTQTRTTETLTTTYTWEWDADTLQYVKTPHVGQPVAGAPDTRILAYAGPACTTPPANTGSTGSHSTPPSASTGSTTKSVVATTKRTPEAPQTGGVGDNGAAGIITGLSVAAFAALMLGGVSFVMRRRRRA